MPIVRHRRRLPAAFDDVLRRGLARDPHDRYASMAEFRQALADACRSRRLPVRSRLIAAAAGLAALVVIGLAAHAWRTTTGQPSGSAAAPGGSPTQLWILYDKPEDLSLFPGEGGRKLSNSADVDVQHLRMEEPPGRIPPELALPVWPAFRPVLILHSPAAWGFVHPLVDRTLAQRVVKGWPTLLRMEVPPEKNLVKDGEFRHVGPLSDHPGSLWRADAAAWNATRRICVQAPRSQPDNPALLLANLDPADSNDLLGCYQALEHAPPPNAVMVLRYRACSQHGYGSLQVYAGMSLLVPENESGVAAGRIRSLAERLPPKPDDPLPNRWLLRIPAWVTPSVSWQEYLVIYEAPPFSAQTTSHKLVIDMNGTNQVSGG